MNPTNMHHNFMFWSMNFLMERKTIRRRQKIQRDKLWTTNPKILQVHSWSLKLICVSLIYPIPLKESQIANLQQSIGENNQLFWWLRFAMFSNSLGKTAVVSFLAVTIFCVVLAILCRTAWDCTFLTRTIGEKAILPSNSGYAICRFFSVVIN